MKYFSHIIALMSIVAIASCNGQSQNKSEASAEENGNTEMRQTQYTVQGQALYSTYCANCHQKEGNGLAGLYPPLAGSDFLLADLSRAACGIKNGLKGEILVNGKTYNMPMPANNQLSPLEIAEIITYISNSWGNNKGLSGVKEVEKWLMECE
jgi:cytochrome c551